MALDVVKLGRKGQVTIPAAIRRELGLAGGAQLAVELAPDGTILLRPAGIWPIEISSDERIAQFLAENELHPELDRRVEAHLDRR